MTRLSPRLALFNNHINDADPWVRAYMQQYAPEYLLEIEALESEHGGVMALLTVPQTLAISFYYGMICAAVNRHGNTE